MLDFLGLLTFVYMLSYFPISISILVFSELGLANLNPMAIKRHFKCLNIFGVILVTIFFNIYLLPYAPFYWIYKLMTFKKENTFR